MNEHLRRSWGLARTASGPGARLQHVFLPGDPVEAHALLVGLATGHTGRRARTAAGATPYDHARIADIAADEGFSHHPTRGGPPSSGFMASYHADDGSPEAAVHHISQLGPEHIAEHRGAIAHHLHQPDSYQGGWHDTGTGHVYLDASKHFGDEGAVREFAADQHQKAYFKLDDFTERFMDPRHDPLAMKDEGAWHDRYSGVGTEPHPRYSEYAHKYPPSDEQREFWNGRGHHIGSKDQTGMAGRPVGAFRSDHYVERETARRAGYLG